MTRRSIVLSLAALAISLEDERRSSDTEGQE
jgi:hypothetical protein